MMKRAFSLAALLLGTVLLTACTQPEPQESSVAEETTAVTTEAVTTAPPPTAKELRRALIESIKVDLDAGKYEDAMKKIDGASDSKRDTALHTLRTRAESELMQKTAEKIDPMLESNDLDGALEELRKLVKANPSSEQLAARLEELQNQRNANLTELARAEVNNYLARLEYNAALTYITEKIVNYPELTELVTIKEQLPQLYAEAALRDAQALADAGNYAEAAAHLDVALAYVSDNADLKAKRDEYQNAQPKYLQELPLAASNGVIKAFKAGAAGAADTERYLTDSSGTLHEYSIFPGDRYWEPEDCYLLYNLGGMYHSLNAVLASNAACRSLTTGTLYMEIYGDDRLLYQSPVMTGTVGPQTISVDLTGVMNLKIVYPAKLTLHDSATLYDAKIS